MNGWDLRSDRVRLSVTEEGGHLSGVRFETERGPVEPLHVAPWAAEALGPDVPPILRILRGDFFCAPFGGDDELPPEWRVHGAPANARWRLLSAAADRLELELEPRVMGARLVKRVLVRPGEAIVYQEHVFEGGTGRLPVGHHVMLRAPDAEPLLLGFSGWTWGGTPPQPLEGDPAVGRSLLKYPAEFRDLGRVPLAAGGAADLTRFPALERSDDLLLLAADRKLPLAWSAATASRAGWVWFDLRSPRELASTVLWMSHGGRDYAPWNGRHTHVIGIEEVTGFFHRGQRESVADNPLAARGIPTAIELRPGESVTIRYAFGVTAVPAGFGRVHAIQTTEKAVQLVDAEGVDVIAAVEAGFLRSTNNRP